MDKHQSSKQGNDFFNRFMFGFKNEPPVSEPTSKIKSIEKYLENVDIEEMLENIDFMMTTAKQIKPYISKLSPLLKKFTK